MNPKFKVDDTIECEAIVGWVKDVFVSINDPSKFVYAIEEPESEAIYFYSEEEVSH